PRLAPPLLERRLEILERRAQAVGEETGLAHPDDQCRGVGGTARGCVVALQPGRARPHLLEELAGGVLQARSHPGEERARLLPGAAAAPRPRSATCAAAEILEEPRDRAVRDPEPELGDHRF